MWRKAHVTIGLISFILSCILLIITYLDCKYPKIYTDIHSLIAAVGLFLPSVFAAFVVFFNGKGKEKIAVSICINILFIFSIIFLLFSYLLTLTGSIFYSETTLIENYMQFDDTNNANYVKENSFLPEYIPNEAKAIIYRYCDYKRIAGGMDVYLEMELPQDLYESKKQTMIALQNRIENNSNYNDSGAKEYDGFTAIVLLRGGGYDEIFYYSDEQLKVIYELWSLGW